MYVNVDVPIKIVIFFSYVKLRQMYQTVIMGVSGHEKSPCMYVDVLV